MGTLKVSASINGNDVLTSPISLSVSKTVSADSGFLSKAKIASINDNTTFTLFKAQDKTSAILYVKNMSNVEEDYIYLLENQDEVFAKISGGGFAILPVNPLKTIRAYGTKVDQIVEYGVFGTDSSAVSLV